MMNSVSDIEAKLRDAKEEVAKALAEKATAERAYRTARKRVENLNNELLQAYQANIGAAAKKK